MKNEFLPYDRALKLKQLGFDEPCFARFNNYGDLLIAHTEKYIIDNGVDRSEFFTLAPIFSQAFRWFRDKYFIHGEPKYDGGLTKETAWYDYTIISNIDWDNSKIKDNQYKTYEEAELACLDKLIEIVTKQQEQCLN
jgi:hypothetical protein